MSSQNISPRLTWTFFILGCIGYILLKWQDLSLPMYWDEIGVYGPGIIYMLDHGISLLPSGLDPELSRGHPLWFYALFASSSKLFGYSLFKLHAFALSISLALFVSVFYIAKKLTSELSALLITFWLMAQGAVFAQSSLALPEILLSLEILWGLYFFFQKKYYLFVLAASLALLTKESALVLPIACFCWQFWVFIRKKEDFQYKAMLYSLAPVLPYLTFLLIQKQTHDWYFFPYHMELVQINLEEILKKLGDYSSWLFLDQGRWILVFVCLYFLGLMIYKQADFTVRFMSLLLIFALGFLAFASLNVYMDRYLMTLFPLLAISMAFFLEKLEANTLKKTGIGVLMIGFSLFNFSQDEFRFDVDINYRDYLAVQKEASEYLEAKVPANEPFLGNFPLFNGFQDPRFGFARDTLHNSVTTRPQDSLRFRALLVPPSFANALPKEGKLLEVFEKGFTRVEIYLKEGNSLE